MTGELEAVVDRILADHNVRDLLSQYDRFARIRGTPEWWDMRDSLPDDARVPIGLIRELREARRASAATDAAGKP